MIYDRFYDTSEKTLYFQCFWPFFRGFKSRLAHHIPGSFGSRGFFCLRQKAPVSEKRPAPVFYAPKHVNMMIR